MSGRSQGQGADYFQEDPTGRTLSSVSWLCFFPHIFTLFPCLSSGCLCLTVRVVRCDHPIWFLNTEQS